MNLILLALPALLLATSVVAGVVYILSGLRGAAVTCVLSLLILAVAATA